jgi:hypothetical protein
MNKFKIKLAILFLKGARHLVGWQRETRAIDIDLRKAVDRLQSLVEKK